MGIPLLEGRLLSPSDGPGAPDVVVVSRSFAEQVWPNESALGKRIYRTGPIGAWTVVGIVGDVRHKTLAAPAEPTLYRTVMQVPMRRLYLVVRTAREPGAVLRSVQQAIWELDSETPITEAGLMAALVMSSEADDWFRTLLMWTFAAFATVLAAVGLFGVTARIVSEREKELGIRAALGAPRGSLVALALRGGLRPAITGLCLGLVAAFWSSRVVESLLFGIDARDSTTYAGVSAFTAVLCASAAYLPARRVTRMPLDVVLRR